MKLLFIDFETTMIVDNKIDECRILEVGLELHESFNDGGHVLLNRLSFLVKPEGYKHDPKTTALCGITEDMINDSPVNTALALNAVRHHMARADYMIAHNSADFDAVVLRSEAKRENVELPDVPWIDTKTDVPYPFETRKLTYIAAELGIVNRHQHRAGYDVEVMADVFFSYDVETIIKMSKSPNITVRADVKPPWEDGGKSTDMAKKRGYRFDSTRKMWLKVIKEFQIEAERTEAGFPITVGKKQNEK